MREKFNMADVDPQLLNGRPLSDLRVVDLRKELEKRGLSKQGQKKELLERLNSYLVEQSKKSQPKIELSERTPLKMTLKLTASSRSSDPIVQAYLKGEEKQKAKGRSQSSDSSSLSSSSSSGSRSRSVSASSSSSSREASPELTPKKKKKDRKASPAPRELEKQPVNNSRTKSPSPERVVIETNQSSVEQAEETPEANPHNSVSPIVVHPIQLPETPVSAPSQTVQKLQSRTPSPLEETEKPVHKSRSPTPEQAEAEPEPEEALEEEAEKDEAVEDVADEPMESPERKVVLREPEPVPDSDDESTDAPPRLVQNSVVEDTRRFISRDTDISKKWVFNATAG